MKINDNLNNIFNLPSEPSKEAPVEMPVALTQTQHEQKEDDYDLARNTLRNLIGKNEAVISDLVDLARNSEHPRAYEVAGQLIKAQSEIAKDLLDLHKQKKDIDGESSEQNIKTQNNIVFAGSTSDLMKMISQTKANVIESK